MLHIKHICSTNMTWQFQAIRIGIYLLNHLHWTNLFGRKLVALTSRKMIFSQDCPYKITYVELKMLAFLICLFLFRVSSRQVFKNFPVNILQTYHKIVGLAMDSRFALQHHQVKWTSRLYRIHNLEWTETSAPVNNMVMCKFCLAKLLVPALHMITH